MFYQTPRSPLFLNDKGSYFQFSSEMCLHLYLYLHEFQINRHAVSHRMLLFSLLKSMKETDSTMEPWGASDVATYLFDL